MKTQHQIKTAAAALAVATVTLAAFVPQSRALDSLTNGVVAYWPMDQITCVTPDLGPNGFDLRAYNNAVPVAFNGANITLTVGGGPHTNINGKQNGTNCLVTSIGQATMLGYIAPVTSPTQVLSLSLPPLNLPNWTISFWMKATNTGGNVGNRFFAISERPIGNQGNLLWDLTCNNGGDANQLAHFRRHISQTLNGIMFVDDN